MRTCLVFLKIMVYPRMFIRILIPICSDVSTFFSLSVDGEKNTMIMVLDKYASSRFVTFCNSVTQEKSLLRRRDETTCTSSFNFMRRIFMRKKSAFSLYQYDTYYHRHRDMKSCFVNRSRIIIFFFL